MICPVCGCSHDRPTARRCTRCARRDNDRNQRAQRRAEALHNDLLETDPALCVLALVVELARQAGVFSQTKGAIQP